jgi:hypothetical protein
MITRRGLVGLSLGSAVMLAISGCSLVEPSETLRYKLTVDVETPEGITSGYSVWELTMTSQKFSSYATRSSYRGEAVAVDLPNGQTVFALLANEYPKEVIIDEMKRRLPDNWRTPYLELFPVWRANKVRWTVPRMRTDGCTSPAPQNPRCNTDAYPMLVWFRDKNDPTSVQTVNPDDLAAIFGKGYQLKAITVQVTDWSVTTGIEKRFSWWEDFRDKQLDDQSYNNSTEFSNSLNQLSFSRGMNNE